MGPRRRGLCIPRFRLPPKTRSRRRSSSPARTRFAGLRPGLFQEAAPSSLVSRFLCDSFAGSPACECFGFAKTSAQGGIHFRRAIQITQGSPKSFAFWGGGDSRDRTGDLLLARQALSQLSYIPSSSSQTSHHSFPSFEEISLVPLLLLFQTNPLRWALFGFLSPSRLAPSKLNNVNFHSLQRSLTLGHSKQLRCLSAP